MGTCLKLPTVTLPTLPFPLSLTVPSASIEFDVRLCCKLPPIKLATPPIPIPTEILNPPIILALNAYIQQALTYINSLAIPCPLE